MSSFDNPRPLWDTGDVARIRRCSTQTVEIDRIKGIGPPFVKIGRTVRYRPEEVEAWIASLPSHKSTLEYETSQGSREKPRNIKKSESEDEKAPAA